MAATRGGTLAAVVLTLATALAACSDPTGSDEADRTELAPTGRATTGTAASSTPTPSPSSETTTAPSTETARAPLVLAVHPTRPAIDVSLRVARDLAAGSVTDWRALDQPPARIRYVSAARQVARDPDALAVLPAAQVGPGVRAIRVAGVHPLRSPSTYRLTTPAAVEPPQPVVVRAVGDLMLARRVGARMAADGDLAAALRPTAALLARADLTVGNLESTLSRSGAPRQGGDSFGADPGVLAGLELAGLDVLSLANNHVGDYGELALLQTVRRVRRTSIEPVGAGVDRAAALRPAVVERAGLRFGFLAFDAIGETPAAGPGTPGALRIRMQPRTGPLNGADLARVADAVQTLRSRVDVVVVLAHWGTQYTYDTVRDQRVVARALADAGAGVVLGGHPHWVQGVELHPVDSRPRSLIAYSLGNYVFDMDFSRQTEEGVILELVFWGRRLKAVELVPVVIGPDFAPRVARGAAGATILDRVWQAGGPPLSGSHRVP